MTAIAHLTGRAVLALSGPDRLSFLQGLVSADIALVAPGRAVWTALLSPQGKWLADFFVFAEGDRYLLDVDSAQREQVAKLLGRYRLRAKADLAPLELPVHAAWDGAPPPGGIQAPDPRLAEAGTRILGGALDANASEADYDRHRLALGLPDGLRDLEPEKTVLLEAGFDELGAIGWDKGCYMGQELTARTRYRGLIKRRLTPVRVDGPLPPSGTPVLKDGVEVGTMRSGREGRALATLKLDALRAPQLRCGDATLYPEPAHWMRWEEVKLASL